MTLTGGEQMSCSPRLLTYAAGEVCIKYARDNRSGDHEPLGHTNASVSDRSAYPTNEEIEIGRCGVVFTCNHNDPGSTVKQQARNRENEVIQGSRGYECLFLRNKTDVA